jgi:hypothetical protein
MTPTDRLRWRRQALTWLRADLLVWDERQAADPSAGPLVAQTMRHWRSDPDLAGLRDAAQLARLPAEERAACQRLWIDVAALVRQAEGRK